MNKIIKINNNEKKYYVHIKYDYFKKKIINLTNKKNKIFIIIDTKVFYLLNKIKFKNNVQIIKIKSG